MPRTRSLLFCTVLTAMFLGLVVCPVTADIQTGLVGHWKFDEGTGTTPQDSSSYGNHGAFVGAPVWVDGKIGKALQFDGVDDYVEVPHHASLTVDTEVTVSAWVYAERYEYPGGGYQGIISKSNSPRSYSLYTTSGGVLHFSTAGVGTTSTPTVPLNEWVHVAAMVVGGAHRYYINGQPAGEGGSGIVLPGAADTADVLIGDTWEASREFGGMIDDVRIYSRALTADDITELYTWVGGANAGRDFRVYGGDRVTLNGSGPPDATSVTWQQVAGTPTVTLDATADPYVKQFNAPSLEIGTLLTFRLSVDAPSTLGVTSDDVDVIITAINPPKPAPGPMRVMPLDLGTAGLGFRATWPPLLDAEQYDIGLDLGGGSFFWLETIAETTCEQKGMTVGQLRTIAIRGKNEHGASDDPASITVISHVGMRNVARPASLGGTSEPSDYVYAVSQGAITGMNDIIYTGSNDSWNGAYKAEDYWGYLWPSPMFFDHIAYYTGDMFWDGGWFLDLKVQYTEDGTTWLDAPILKIEPAYDYTDQQTGKQRFTRYDIFIPTLRGTGIRIAGTPGGVATFTSIAELEVFGLQTQGPLIVQGVDAEFPEGGPALLNGSLTFSTAGPITSYQWTGPGGITITNPTGAIASFQAPNVAGDTEYVFTLTASDGTNTDTDDDVRITIKNLVTTAVAGVDQRVKEQTQVTLNASGSMTTTGNLTYLWTQTSGTDMGVSGSTDAIVTFTPPPLWGPEEELTFQLAVNDGAGGQSTDTVTVIVENSHFRFTVQTGDIPNDPWGFITKDIPDTITAGDASYDAGSGVYTITGAGADIWGTADQFRFTYLQISGDFEVSVRVEPGAFSGGTNEWAKAGLMVRDNDTAGAACAYQVVTRSSGTAYQWRQLQNAGANWPGASEPAAGAFSYPFWLRIRREGNTLYGDYSTNGVSWSHQSTASVTIAATDPVLVGTCVTSHETGVLTTVEFSDFRINGAAPVRLTNAYAARTLPQVSYATGVPVSVELSVRVNPAAAPASVDVVEQIPEGIAEADVSAPGATVGGGQIRWTLTGNSVKTQTLTYSVTPSEGMTDTLGFEGMVSFPGDSAEIFGDSALYPQPDAPRGLVVDMLQAAHLSWSPPLTVGTASYNLYRSVNGGAYELIATTTSTSYTDKWVSSGNTYAYEVSAVNILNDEGPLSRPTAQVSMPTMDVRESEDFNYGGGQYPGSLGCPAANEAPAATDLDAQYDFFHPNVGGPDPAIYRTNNPLPDGIGIETVEEVDDPGVFHTNIGWVDVGSWYRYTYNVPQAGWVKFEFRVASPDGGALAAYWDETLVGTVSYDTDNWHIFTWVLMEDEIQTTTGVHTLRVESIAGGVNFDKHAIQWNAAPPARASVWEDNFDSYASTADVFSPTNGKWTRGNTTNSAGSWTLWDTSTPLGSESGDIPAMEGNYMVSDSDLSGAGVLLDEEMLSPEVDCTGWTKLRLNFNKNYRIYDDPEHTQDAEVDIRSFDAGTGWSNWTNLLHLDISSVPAGLDPPILSDPEMFDLSAYDGKKIQLKFHFFNAQYDYWFAVDKIRVSGVQEAVEIPRPDVGVSGGNVTVGWEPFAAQYTVEYATNPGGPWTQVAGPFPQTSYTQAIPGDKAGYWRIVGQ